MARQVHQIAPRIPIVIQTGFLGDELLLEGLDAMCVAAVLRKPILRIELNECIRKALETRQCRRPVQIEETSHDKKY